LGFITTKRIKEAYIEDEFYLIIIYGPLRYGKSSLAVQILAEVYGTWDLDVLKKYIGFHPKEVLTHWAELKGKHKAYVWDDAGLWLHALEWNSPFVRAAGKYLNVAGTDWAGLILTTPLPTWISRKIRGIPQATTIKVRKVTAKQGQEHLRQGVAYRFWQAPDMKKSGVHKLYIENFSKMMPDNFYEWYKPKRDKYAQMAKRLMRKELRTLPEVIEDVGIYATPPRPQM